MQSPLDHIRVLEIDRYSAVEENEASFHDYTFHKLLQQINVAQFAKVNFLTAIEILPESWELWELDVQRVFVCLSQISRMEGVFRENYELLQNALGASAQQHDCVALLTED